MQEIDKTIGEIVAFIPMLKKQLEQNPRGYYASR
jgi:hypothetical protein